MLCAETFPKACTTKLSTPRNAKRKGISPHTRAHARTDSSRNFEPLLRSPPFNLFNKKGHNDVEEPCVRELRNSKPAEFRYKRSRISILKGACALRHNSGSFSIVKPAFPNVHTSPADRTHLTSVDTRRRVDEFRRGCLDETNALFVECKNTTLRH